MKAVRQEINDKGLKVTTQRTVILEAIRNGQGHVDAVEVHRQIQSKLPRISLSTVYRTLQRFKELGLVEELHFSEEHHHYELKPEVEHYHLVCLDCSAVIEFQYPLIRNVTRTVKAATGFKITGSDVTLIGYCQQCQKDKKEKKL